MCNSFSSYSAAVAHNKLPIIVYRSSSVVVPSVCPLVIRMHCGKTADSIEMPFGMVSGVGPRNRVLDGRAHGRHLVNTVERLCAAVTSVSDIRVATNLSEIPCVRNMKKCP